LFFTANYAPPCVSFQQTFATFCNEANKDPNKRKFEVVVVNCDASEETYKLALSKMPTAWYNVPYEA
jgi:hypothetical protein